MGKDRKYGPDSFECKILEDNINDQEVLKEREIYWIDHYNTFCDGLNATMGGDGNKIADVQKIKMLWNEGHCVRDISILMNIWPKTVLQHLDVPLEECQRRGPIYKSKNSEKYFGNYQYGRASSVSCFDMKTGEKIKSFPSYHQAAKFVGAKTVSSIFRAAEGRIQSAYGYYWKAGDTETKLSEDDLSERKQRHKRINEYVVCIEENKMYSDTKYAEKITGINYRSISFACHGYQKTAGGFHWRYATKEDKEN